MLLVFSVQHVACLHGAGVGEEELGTQAGRTGTKMKEEEINTSVSMENIVFYKVNSAGADGRPCSPPNTLITAFSHNCFDFSLKRQERKIYMHYFLSCLL